MKCSEKAVCNTVCKQLLNELHSHNCISESTSFIGQAHPLLVNAFFSPVLWPAELCSSDSFLSNPVCACCWIIWVCLSVVPASLCFLEHRDGLSWNCGLLWIPCWIRQQRPVWLAQPCHGRQTCALDSDSRWLHGETRLCSGTCLLGITSEALGLQAFCTEEQAAFPPLG